MMVGWWVVVVVMMGVSVYVDVRGQEQMNDRCPTTSAHLLGQDAPILDPGRQAVNATAVRKTVRHTIPPIV